MRLKANDSSYPREVSGGGRSARFLPINLLIKDTQFPKPRPSTASYDSLAFSVLKLLKSLLSGALRSVAIIPVREKYLVSSIDR